MLNNFLTKVEFHRMLIGFGNLHPQISSVILLVTVLLLNLFQKFCNFPKDERYCSNVVVALAVAVVVALAVAVVVAVAFAFASYFAIAFYFVFGGFAVLYFTAADLVVVTVDFSNLFGFATACAVIAGWVQMVSAQHLK